MKRTPTWSSARRPHGGGRVLALVVFAAAVAFASWLLVPCGVELAALRLAAGDPVAARAVLERAVAGGDRSPATRAALARARADSGDMPGSIELLRQLAAERPEDTASLQALADALLHAGQPAAALELLDRLQRIEPRVQRQRDIVGIDAAGGFSTRLEADLAAMIDRYGGGEVADYLALARLQQAGLDPHQAVRTLDRMVAHFPRSLDASVVAAQIEGLLGAGDAEDAMRRAEARLSDRADPIGSDAPILAGAFTDAGRPDLGAALLEPLRRAPQAAPEVLVAWAQAMTDSGQSDAALAGLRASPSAAVGAAPRLQRLQLTLALGVGELDAAIDMARRIGVPSLQPRDLDQLAEALLNAHRRDVLRSLGIRDVTIGARNPVLAARLAFTAGEVATARRWSTVALASMHGHAEAAADLSSRLSLARLLHGLGDDASALALLRRGVPPPQGLDEYARTWIAIGRADAGCAILSPLPENTTDALAGAWAWAMLATAAGRDEAVMRWLRERQPDVRPGAARDVLHLAIDRHADRLAIAIGERLLESGGDDADRAALAQALLDDGRPADAVGQMRVLRAHGHIDQERYLWALYAAWRQGSPMASELRELALHRLADGETRERRDADIGILLALDANAEVLPTLEPLAIAEPARWLGAFAGAATKAGELARLRSVWVRLASSPATPPPLRVQIAYRLLYAGDKAAAEATLRSVAAAAAADDAVTRSLLFLWGPRPARAQLDWLEARARAAAGDERGRWMRLLMESGGADRVVALYLASPLTERDAALNVALQASAQLGPGMLATVLREAATRPHPASVWSAMARRASTSGDSRLERRLIQVARAAGADDAPLARAAGLLALRQGEIPIAERELSDYVGRSGGDPEALRALADAQSRRHEATAAHASYGRALAMLDDASGPPADDAANWAARVSRAGLLYKLNRADEAGRLYAELLRERPADNDLRADYAGMLLDLGDQARARAVLAAR